MNRTLYHVFTDHKDSFFLTLSEAKDEYEQFAKENACVRLYWELENEEGDTLDANCLQFQGAFPL